MSNIHFSLNCWLSYISVPNTLNLFIAREGLLSVYGMSQPLCMAFPSRSSLWSKSRTQEKTTFHSSQSSYRQLRMSFQEGTLLFIRTYSHSLAPHVRDSLRNSYRQDCLAHSLAAQYILILPQVITHPLSFSFIISHIHTT